jgi:hypothetical protein
MKVHRVVRRRGFHIFYTIGSQMTVRLSASRSGQEATWYSLLLEAESTPVQLEELGKLKKSNDRIGNRTRDLPACRMVPQQITLPRAPEVYSKRKLKSTMYKR